jgi:hypothetical protein
MTQEISKLDEFAVSNQIKKKKDLLYNMNLTNDEENEVFYLFF